MNSDEGLHMDKEQLYNQYFIEGKSLREIASECGCSATTVSRWMRSCGYSSRPSSHKTCLDAPYSNKSWLENEYISLEKSSQQIANEVGCSNDTVSYWLKKHDIDIRSRGLRKHLATTNHVEINPRLLEWLNGELLGDGSVRSKNKYSARVEYSSKYEEYIEYISTKLKSFGIDQTGEISSHELWHGGRGYHYHSKYYAELFDIRNKWYPDGVKIVPSDLELSPVTVRQWFIGDGCLKFQKDGNSYITFYTNGFDPKYVDLLAEKLSEVGFTSSRRPSDNTIGIRQRYTEDFFDYIGGCPVECYKYKWNYRGG